MQIDGYTFMVDVVTKFFNTIRISGWFYHHTDTLTGVALVGDTQLASVSATGVEYTGAVELGPNKGFSLQVLRQGDTFNESAELQFTTAAGWTGRVRLVDLCAERTGEHPTQTILSRFVTEMDAQPGARVLDIGGRVRSQFDHSNQFSSAECVVLDILPGENVDVVGDAHDMASLFPPESFDGIYSLSVFEHLLMPWAVAVQMNRILKPGGLGYVFTHQLLGIHDAPWDFWRFSNTSWEALFNAHTGFEILDRAMDRAHFALPFIWRPDKEEAEHSAGFEGSAVLVRKTGPCRLSWPMTPVDVTATMYPGGTP